MVTQSNNLNFTPGQISPRVNVSQYDKKSRTLTFSLYNGSQPFNISNGMAVTIEGTKPDNTGFQYAMIATAGSNVVSISIEQQMTVIAGDVPCEIVVSNAGKRLASANFILVVEPAALNENTIISETELPLIEEAAELAENIAIYVTTIHEDALKAEGYAVGKQNGVDVGSGSVYFHNNAKYHNEQAAISATNASNSATAASTAASTATTKASEATSAASTATSKASEATTAAQTATTKASEASASAQTAQEAAESLIGEVVDSEPYVLRQGLGNLADMNLVGGSLAWNQLVSNGNFADTSGWSAINASFSVSNNVATITATSANITQGLLRGGNSYIPGHKYLAGFDIKSNNTSAQFGVSLSSSSLNTNNVYSQIKVPRSWARYEKVVDVSSESSGMRIATYANATLAINDTFELRNVNVFDLTQMFGSTIADYIYSLETATAGAGVAWFRKYFPNAYYGYQSGKIESVNVASRKVVGKNLLNIQLPSETKNGVTLENNGDGTYKLTGTPSTSSGSFESTQTMELDVGTYIWRASLDDSDIGGESIGYAYIKGLNGTTNWYRSYGGEQHYKLIVTKKSTIKLGFSWYNATSALDITFYPMIRLATVEDATYEPYQSSTYTLDSSIQLRGIPKLVDNKLSYDGDIYTADGTVTRKYGIVDLGTLTWAITNNCFNSQNLSSNGVAKVNTSTNSENPIICAKYLTKATRNTTANYNNLEIGLSIASTAEIIIKDTSYSDVATFKTAMSGVYAIYELATPTTESANAYQNPQRAFIDGTEEFVDYGVQSATRDVSIPVGNNTTYQLNETLPPIEDYVDGALKFKAAISALGTDESGRTTASRAYTTGDFFYKDGKMYKVLTSIAQGATFTINTNCQQTTLFAELKALAQ